MKTSARYSLCVLALFLALAIWPHGKSQSYPKSGDDQELNTTSADTTPPIERSELIDPCLVEDAQRDAREESLPRIVQKTIARERARSYSVERLDSSGGGIDVHQPKPQFSFRNAAEKLKAVLRADQIALSPTHPDQDWHLSLTVTRFGWEGSEEAVVPGTIRAQDNRLDIDRGSLTEWYVNTPNGLEQGFTVSQAPARQGETLVVHMEVDSGLMPQLQEDGKGIDLIDDGKSVLTYSGLVAYDSDHNVLPARMSLTSSGWQLSVEAQGASFPVTIDPFFRTIDKLIATNNDFDDEFGFSIASDQDRIVVGAYRARGFAEESGLVYVFRNIGDQTWTQEAVLAANDGQSGDRFGYDVDIEGDRIVVGAYLDDELGLDTGAAYVFRYQGGTNWTQEARLLATDVFASNSFGFAVGYSKERVVVGARLDDDAGINAGAAYVFEPTMAEGVWAQTAKFTAIDAADGALFGYAVDLSGDHLMVGAPFDRSRTGSVYAFDLSNADPMNTQQKLEADNGTLRDLFGRSVAVNDNLLVVGAPMGDGLAAESGTAYVFNFDGSSWSQDTQVNADDGQTGDRFGRSVAVGLTRVTAPGGRQRLTGDRVLVGAPGNDNLRGAVYSFQRFDTTEALDDFTWQPEIKVVPSDVNIDDRFGMSLTALGQSVFVGAPFDDDGGRNAGSVYFVNLPRSLEMSLFDLNAPIASSVFVDADGDSFVAGGPDARVFVFKVLNNEVIVEEDELIPSPASSTFGGTNGRPGVDLDGDRVIVGSQGDGAYVFTIDAMTGQWSQEGSVLLGGANSAGVGQTVALEGDRLLVGAPEADGMADGSFPGTGALFVYDRNPMTGIWGLTQRLFPSDGDASNRFGFACALDGDRLVVGDLNEGAAYVFEFNGSVWQETQKLSNPESSTGIPVGLKDDRLVVGDPRADSPVNADAGVVRTYRLDGGGVWNPESVLYAFDGQGFDDFGNILELDGDQLLVRSQAADGIIPDRGAAYLFEDFNRDGAWENTAKMFPSVVAHADVAGVSLSQGRAVLGVRHGVALFEAVTRHNHWCNGRPSGQKGSSQAMTMTLANDRVNFPDQLSFRITGGTPSKAFALIAHENRRSAALEIFPDVTTLLQQVNQAHVVGSVVALDSNGEAVVSVSAQDVLNAVSLLSLTNITVYFQAFAVSNTNPVSDVEASNTVGVDF